MHPVWKEVLEAANAEVDADGLARFHTADPVQEATCRLFDRSHLGLIAVRGADAFDFLQGQVTNDLRELSATHVQWNAHCSQKGRILASFLTLRIDDTLYLQLPRERIPDLLKRLRMFVLRSRVTLEDMSDDVVHIALAGDCAQSLLEGRGLPAPEQDNALARHDQILVIRLPGPVMRFQIMGTPESLKPHWDAFITEASPSNPGAWDLLDIRAGIPIIRTATAEAFVPQMINLHLIDGVSFHKGCYTGQEVVARMQYLGKLKRRMYRAEVETDTPPQPGTELHSSVSTSGQGSGAVVASSPGRTGHYELLAVVENKAVDADDVRLGGADGPRLLFKPLPYAFETTPS